MTYKLRLEGKIAFIPVAEQDIQRVGAEAVTKPDAFVITTDNYDDAQPSVTVLTPRKLILTYGRF